MEAFKFVFDVIRSNIKLPEKFTVDLDEGLYTIDVLTRLWESVEESTDTSFLYWSLDNMVTIFFWRKVVCFDHIDILEKQLFFFYRECSFKICTRIQSLPIDFHML